MKRFTPFHLVLVGIILAGLYLAYMTYANWTVLRTIESSAPGHNLSQEAADLDVVMIYDYSCPFCNRIDPTIRAAVEEDGAVNLIYKFIPAFGERSDRLARLAFAAGKQDSFLPVHDYLVANSDRQFTDGQIEEMAGELGLDYEQLQGDMNSEEATETIQENFSLAREIGVRGTPSFLIGPNFYVPEGQMPDEQRFLDLFQEARQDKANS